MLNITKFVHTLYCLKLTYSNCVYKSILNNAIFIHFCSLSMGNLNLCIEFPRAKYINDLISQSDNICVILTRRNLV